MSGGHEIEPATVSLAPLDDMGVNRAMAELAEWCARHFHLIEQGRKVGVRLGASAAVKDAIVMFCPDRKLATKIAANLLDVDN